MRRHDDQIAIFLFGGLDNCFRYHIGFGGYRLGRDAFGGRSFFDCVNDGLSVERPLRFNSTHFFGLQCKTTLEEA